MSTMSPKCILIFSGKRKCGKDFVTDLLFQRVGLENCALLKLSGPIKKKWAEANNLDFAKLMDSSEYKEIYRAEMNKYGEEMRNKDYGYFCRASIEMYEAEKKAVWIISDARRKTDLKWFKERYDGIVKTIRVQANDEVRKSRGWTYTSGVDDAETECGLDTEETWDWVIQNDGSGTQLDDKLNEIIQWTQENLK
ncbi:hypothetical protein J437_LFUL015364 [Ladona fulva]|uniref:Phosphomevalonate kinase n=1 Tax=Ladona fulva TaxID=123851 RepID=A0A8K0P740_LADFU|nr:hypothetical protein J437_LFUL015364 [Ladona fulva]